jgi:hypothetical protein
MSKRTPTPKREPRHKLALDTARYTALNAANAEAKTNFTTAEAGKDSPHFRRVYVKTFADTYGAVIHDR